MAVHLFLLCAILAGVGGFAGETTSDQLGRVVFGGLPVPGATVTASRGDEQLVTVTDQQGGYRLADLAEGVWTIRVEMLGFVTASRDVTIESGGPPITWELSLKSFEDIIGSTAANSHSSLDARASKSDRRDASTEVPSPSAATSENAQPEAGSGSGSRGFRRTAVNAAPGAALPLDEARSPGDDAGRDLTAAAAEGFLVNGSVNNAAASPFSQLAAFGNNRRTGRSLYTGGLGTILGNSAWDARPYSFTGQDTPKPSYSDVQVMGVFGGPLRIPGLLKRGPNMFVGYQHTSDHTTVTKPALMPTVLERAGDFSQTRDARGRGVQIVDPSTGLPFPGGVIPRDRISPQAAALLGYYPMPNVDGIDGYNYQTPLLTATKQDGVQTRFTQPPFGRNQFYGNFAYQRVEAATTNAFGFADANGVSGVDTAINWSRQVSQFFSFRIRYQYLRTATDVTPYFANRRNVSGDAGITGNNQDPVNWGPPNLLFSSGVESLTEVQYASNTNQTHVWSAESLWGRGRHGFTFGGDVRQQNADVFSQQNARGEFSFTGALTGSDLADFLLGIPHTSAIASGNPDKYLRASAYALYLTDDWRLSPGLTVNAGVRWEYETPMTELFGRLVNLDIAREFAAISPVVASNPVGSLTGTQYPDSLIRSDFGGIQPRMGVAWRPLAGSSLVVRAGYGVYRNTSVYQPITLLLAQQPPLSKSFSIQNSPANPLTLADGFIVPPGVTPNTFAVDPDLRVGYAQTWQVSVQRDLPESLTVLATYLGTRGNRLMQEFLPNTYPAGTQPECIDCPSGFVYLTSGGRSTRHAGQFQLRRRLRSGLTATVQYTLAKARDNAGAFTGVNLSGTAIAQNWLDLDAEWAPSNFDQRHLATAQFQYSTGVGRGGSTLAEGWKGSFVNLSRGWTLTGQLTAGSGLPLTPVYFAPVTGTGVTGTLRPDEREPIEAIPPGSYANPRAFAFPTEGHWGNAGRNSLTGPAQFALNAGIMRTFAVGDRFSLDWRIDATNVLNQVTYAGVNTLFGSPQFGFPNRTNAMRKLQTTFRLRL
jgi:trimeric autotransporter adhesin